MWSKIIDPHISGACTGCKLGPMLRSVEAQISNSPKICLLTGPGGLLYLLSQSRVQQQPLDVLADSSESEWLSPLHREIG